MKKIVKNGVLIVFILSAVLLLSFCAFGAEKVALKAENTDDGVCLSWTEVKDVYYYEIYRQSKSESTKGLLSRSQTTEFVDSEAVPGTLYAYSVVPFFEKNNNEAESSNTVIITRLSTPKLGKVFSQNDGIHLEWSASPGASGYGIYRQVKGGDGWALAGKTSSGITSFLDNTANTMDTYLYAVRAYGVKALSAPSNYAEATYVGPPRITSVDTEPQGLRITWGEVRGSQYYLVYRITDKDKKWTNIALLDGKHNSYLDTDIQLGMKVGYIIRAIDERGELGPYNKGIVTAYMSVPAITGAESAVGGVKLYWSKSEASQGYAIYRSDFGSEDFKLLGTVKGQNTLTVVDSTAENGRTYVYSVKGVNNGNYSMSAEKGATVRYLACPDKVTLTQDAAHGNVIKWTANPQTKLYCVFSKVNGASWKLLGVTTNTHYADIKASNIEVSYAVRSFISSTCYSSVGRIVSNFDNGYVDPKKPMVALTYDDGPSNEITNRILDVLEEYDAKATFFVLGNRVEYNHEPMQRAVKMGCEIGNHTFDHYDLLECSSSEIVEQISATDKVVKKYAGEAPKIIRAPGGSSDEASRNTAGKPFIYWSVDTRDWESRDASAVIDIAQSQVYDGSIILMHDIYDSTAEASEYIIPWLVSEGYQLVTVSELMKHKGIKLQTGESYEDALG